MYPNDGCQCFTVYLCTYLLVSCDRKKKRILACCFLIALLFVFFVVLFAFLFLDNRQLFHLDLFLIYFLHFCILESPVVHAKIHSHGKKTSLPIMERSQALSILLLKVVRITMG